MFAEDQLPEIFADEFDHVQRGCWAGCVGGESVVGVGVSKGKGGWMGDF